MQPWSLLLHRYSVTIILIGLAAFMVFSHVALARAGGGVMAAIGLRNVEKYFGANYIIRKLNLEIADREFVVLLGPSGCGKTTTLRAIAGLETIDTGDILIDGKPVQDLRRASATSPSCSSCSRSIRT